MLLLIGPPGCGKTSAVLEEVRKALDRGEEPTLIVPTATMAEHLRHRLAREGRVFRPSVITTLAQFVDRYAGGMPNATPGQLTLLVEASLAEAGRSEFAKVEDLAGFASALARTIEEFSTHGCDSRRLLASLPDTPLGVGFVEICRIVESRMRERGLFFRSECFQRAAKRIASEPASRVRSLWFDGFFALSEPELGVIDALRRQAAVTLTLPDDPVAAVTRSALQQMGFREEWMPKRRQPPSRDLFRARTPDQEAGEIARRILEMAGGGRRFRDVGILVRSPEPYLALLEAALSRYGIPYRSYFPQRLAGEAGPRFVSAVIDALLSSWDHDKVLTALKLAGDWEGLDGFDWKVRSKMPQRGLASLQEMAEGRIAALLGRLAALDEWSSITIPPSEWAERIEAIVDWRQPVAVGPTPDRDAILLWKRDLAAMTALPAVLREAAGSLPPAPVGLREYWHAATVAIAAAPLRVPDGRHNVVDVMSVYEARQWELPVVFVCGLVEKQFPRHHPQNPFFSDAARRQLQNRGIRVPATGDLDEEERFLFRFAATRATESLVLSYPESDVRAAPNLRSSFLDLEEVPVGSAIRPRPVRAARLGDRRDIEDPGLLGYLRAKTATMSPSSLEGFLDCPFQYFARRTLGLDTRPLRPDDRLDFLLQGTIVHMALSRWKPGLDPERVFDTVFQEICREKAVPEGYKAESIRQRLLDDVRRYLNDNRLPPRADSIVEQQFSLPVAGDVVIRGRIDRIDRQSDGSLIVIDYKYSPAQRVLQKTRDETRLQGPLYAMAAARALDARVDAMVYCSLRADTQRKEITYAGWTAEGVNLIPRAEPLTREWIEQGVERAYETALEVRSGRISAAPSDRDLCRRCEMRDVCRLEAAGAAGIPQEAATTG